MRLGSPTYAELDRYLREIPARDLPYDALASRAESSRRLNRLIVRANFFLKYASALGLVLSLPGLVFSLFWPELLSGHFLLLINTFLVCTLVKLFGVLVDLETRVVQYLAIIFVTGMMVAMETPTPLVPLATGGFYLVLVTVSRIVKRHAKLRCLEWMMREPDRFPEALREREAEAMDTHSRLGIALFDDPRYRRTFKVTSFKKRRVVEAVAGTEDTRILPPKGHARVEIWRRDPRRDLSSIREFFICCFLGGSQDASAFDFMLSKSITMLDLVSPKGRTIRVLLMACVTQEDGENVPILVVNAVFGREGGWIGSLKDDDPFIRVQVESYARFAGFRYLLYNLTPTNTRPRLFAESSRKAARGKPVRISCRLTCTQQPIKLEIFNRREPTANVYLMLLLEMMNLTDNYATAGRVRGIRIPIENRFQEIERNSGPAEGEVKAIAIRTGPTSLEMDGRLAGETTRLLLTDFFSRFPEAQPTALPETVEVKLGDGGESQLITGNPSWGALRVHPCILSLDQPFWRETIFSAALCQAILWHCHPAYDDELLFRIIDPVIPDFNEQVLASLTTLDGLEESLGMRPGTNFARRLIERAVVAKYDALRVFKFKEIYSFLTGEGERRADEAGSLAESFLKSKLETYAGFREKYLQGLDERQRPVVLGVMRGQIAEVMAEFLEVHSLPKKFRLEEHGDVSEKIFKFEKTVRRYQLTVDEKITARLEPIKVRCKLLDHLVSVENTIDKGKEEKALSQLTMLEKEQAAPLRDLGLLSELRRLRWKARLAPWNRLVERLNMEQYW